MMQGRSGLGLTLKALAGLLIFEEVGSEELQFRATERPRVVS